MAAEPGTIDSRVAEKATRRLVIPIGLSHMSLPVHDVEQAKRFYVDVLRGEALPTSEGALSVRFKDWVLNLAPQAGGWTARGAEYPHYAFTVHPEDFVALMNRLDGCGVPRHEPWDRYDDTEALMYFRDPSGNQFEFYVLKGFKALPLRRGLRAGGDYEVPFESLSYAGLPALAESGPDFRAGALDGFNHMTIPVRDHRESARFFTSATGGRVVINHPTHVTVEVGSMQVGMAPNAGGWTAPNAEYPHYAFLVNPGDLVPLKEQIESFGVPTSPLWTENGADARVYFREPGGNLFELHSPSGFAGASALPRRAAAGVDVAALNYDHWGDPGA